MAIFRRDEALEGHVLLGVFFSLASLILLVLVTFSAPFIPSIHFISAGQTQHGAFGYCSALSGCVKPILGYASPRGEITGWMTRTHIMFGLAALFMLISLTALVLSILHLGTIMRNPIFFRSTALIGTALSLLAVIFALVNFVQARNRFNTEGVGATYGPALWMVIGAAISALLAACIGGPKIQASYMYRADHRVAYNL